MTSILFIHDHTLYAKATLPVALESLARGWNVTFQINRPVVSGYSFGFSEEIIRERCLNVNILNPKAYEFVADVIGLGDIWRSKVRQIRFSMTGKYRPNRFDAVVGTIKNMDILSHIAKKDIPTFALGYQHLPVLIRLDGPLPNSEKDRVWRSVFLYRQSLFKATWI